MNDTSVPSADSTLKIAARHSDLARLQAYRVGDALRASQPGLDIDYAFRASLGDMNLNDPLWKMPEKGVFTEDFVRDLTEGAADMVVHSWKDLPTEPRPHTTIAATLPRADVRDLLLFRKDQIAQAKSLRRIRILTSSPRRAHNLSDFLKHHLPFEIDEVVFENVRGNIPTRLRKLLAQDVEGLIVAKAALDRLLASPEEEFAAVRDVIRETLAQTRFMVLPLTINPTAAAQGALAVEVADSAEHVKAALAKVHCEETFATVSKERQILASYGGGCHQKIGVNVLRRPYGELTFLRGLTDAGVVLDSIRLVPPEGWPAMPRAASATALYPQKGEESGFFEREALSRETWAWAENVPFLWIARESACPQEMRISENAIVWTAGLKTWRKLAERGIWVTGSAEGLGEREPARLEALLENQAIEWVKLTHEASAVGSDSRLGAGTAFRACGTYRLRPRATTPDLSGRTHFFWMSGSTFDRAVELNPHLLTSGHHACGPGATFDHIRQRLGDRVSTKSSAEGPSLSVYLSIEAFREAASPAAN